MLKWIVGAIVAAFLVAFVIKQRDSVKTAYVNGLAPYESLPGRQYIFERDCYIFKFKARDSEFPLVGDSRVVPLLPSEVSEKYVGADLPGVRILDVCRVGDRFRIASVRRDTGRNFTHITFEILFLDEDARKYPRLDAYYIMDHSPEEEGRAPALLPSYAVEAVMH